MKMLSKAGIYKITHITSNRIYVGSSINLKSRKNKHFSALRNNKHANRILQNYFNKYGERSFKWEILERIEFNENKELFKNNLLEREQYWIDELKACENNLGFNICLKAESRLGLEHSEESKQKIRDKRKLQNIKMTDEWRRKIGEANKGNKYSLGKKRSKETGDKISKSLMGKKHSEESKQKMREAHLGKKLTKEHVDKIRETKNNRNYVVSDETKSRISKSLTGKKHSNEAIQKMSKAHKKKVMNVTTGLIFDSVTEACEFYGISQVTHVCRVCKGIEKTAGGFVWEYV